MTTLALLALAGLLAGAMNAIAGGGSFVTFPAMVFAGLPPVIANASSTVALFPGQMVSGLSNRAHVEGAAEAPAMSDRTRRDPITQAVARYLDAAAHAGVTRGQLEDYSAALYIEVDKKISARLWILDTIITAAPLLGLLGTIFGIMQTFTALSEGGVSDPAEVSRGIGLALTATAIGIAVALVGLVGHNVLNRRAQLLTETFKLFVLRLTPATT